jgi:DNA-binding SARP family transcriptional activator
MAEAVRELMRSMMFGIVGWIGVAFHRGIVDIRLLGPVALRIRGRVVEAGPVLQQAVLAALAVDAGRRVLIDTLVDRVWDDAPPPRPRAALYTYVSRLRRLLSEDGDHPRPGASSIRLAGRDGGYVLAVDPDRVDMHRFRRLTVAAKRTGCGAVERASLLAEALDLWSGTPLAGLPGDWAARTRAGWRQERLDAAVGWAGVELQLGRAAEVTDRIRELLIEYPLAEPLVDALMRALAAVGRRAEAVECYGTFRAGIADHLGIEPGPPLRDLHLALLRTEPETWAGSRRIPAVLAAVPAQLPPDVSGFAGRREQVARLDTLLTETANEPTAVLICVVSGTAGVGKTGLAVHWAHQVSERFPDGQLYANLRGFHRDPSPLDPADAILGFLEALGVPPQRVPADLDARIGLYRSLVAGRRILLLLDNARDAEQVRPLLPGSPTAAVVVTSRNQLPGLVAADAAHLLTLDVLSAAEARELLARRLGRERVAAQPQAVQDIIDRCAGLPLALVVAAARAATRPHFALTLVADEMRNTQYRLDGFADGDPATNVRTVLSWSYRMLTPASTRLFRRLGLHPGPDISASAAASLAGVPPSQVRPLLIELANAHLVVEHLPARYTFHDVLRAYAQDLVDGHDTADERCAATYRMLDHYLHTAHLANRLLQPHRDAITVGQPISGVTAEAPADHDQALAWFAAEYRVLLAAIDHAVDTGFDSHAWKLAWTLVTFLDRRGYWREWAAAQHVALAAARRLTDEPAQIHVHRQLAGAYARLGRFADALDHYRQAFDLQSRSGDRLGQARGHFDIGWALARQNRHAEAVPHAEQAMGLYRAAGHRRGEAQALNTLAWSRAQLGDYDQALSYAQQALALFQELDDVVWQAATWDTLGYAHHQLNHHSQAILCYGQALEMFSRLGDRYEQADTLIRLGEAHHRAGNRDAGNASWRQAVDILNDLDHPDAERLRGRLRHDAVAYGN